MDVKDTISRLNLLLEWLIKLDSLQSELDKAKHALANAKGRPLRAVSAYDDEHKPSFIIERIGKEPEKPSKALVLAVPVYLKKKKEYEEKISAYRIAYQIVEKEYQKKHKDIREQLAEEELKERELQISQAESQLDKASSDYNEIQNTISTEEIISDNLKTASNVKMLISFFEEGRSDTIKEAINILFEEMHWQKIEALYKQQLELTEKIAALAKDADEKAEEALEVAYDAKELAEEAYSLAEEANNNSSESDTDDY